MNPGGWILSSFFQEQGICDYQELVGPNFYFQLEQSDQVNNYVNVFFISEFSSSVIVENSFKICKMKMVIIVSQQYECLQKNSSQNSSRNPQRVRFLKFYYMCM